MDTLWNIVPGNIVYLYVIYLLQQMRNTRLSQFCYKQLKSVNRTAYTSWIDRYSIVHRLSSLPVKHYRVTSLPATNRYKQHSDDLLCYRAAMITDTDDVVALVARIESRVNWLSLQHHLTHFLHHCHPPKFSLVEQQVMKLSSRPTRSTDALRCRVAAFRAIIIVVHILRDPNQMSHNGCA